MKVNNKDLESGIYQNLSPLDLKGTTDIFYYRSKNKKSIGFKIDIPKSIADFYTKVFELENPDVFEKKLRQAIGGDGKELNKINALHSSSLCALLMFYNISKDTPFSITIKIDGKEEEHKYTKVYFEVKNKVISRPSNMDVVLVNEETNEILFIECKFSEYLSRSEDYKLPKGYIDNYNRYFEAIPFNEMKVFPEGIKQLVAHYIGIKNFRENKYTKKQLDSFYHDKNDSRRELYKAGGYNHIAFMEVIYKIKGDYFDEYEKETKKTFDMLENEEKTITVAPKITILGTQTYQNLFSGKNSKILSDVVKAFYFKNNQ